MTQAVNHPLDETAQHLVKLKTPADKALLARITRFFADAIVELPATDMTVALQAQDDILAVIETVARRPASASAQYAVKLRGAIQKRKILEAEGGVISPAQAAQLLGISRQTVSQRRTAGKLLAIPVAGGFAYPIWQFHDGESLDGIESILAILAEIDPWMQMAFFLNNNSALDDQRPLDLLKQNDEDKAMVMRAAHAYLEQGPA